MHPEKIIRIKYIGKLPVVDIEVDSISHLYYANGIATSNSHATCYAMLAYETAFQKKHYKIQFYTAALTFAKDKIDPLLETKEICDDCRLHNVVVLPPNIKEKNKDFKITGEKEILFGLSSIRNVGGKAIQKILNYDGDISTFSGILLMAKSIHRNTTESLIKSGACDSYGLSRIQMLKSLYVLLGRSDNEEIEERGEMRGLTPNEYTCLLKYFDLGLETALQKIIDEEACIAKRIPVIQKKIEYLQKSCEDTNRRNALWEKLYLGLALTCSAADDYEKLDKGVKTCRESHLLRNKDKLILHCVIDSLKMFKTKKDQNYCRMDVSDNTGAAPSVIVWPEQYETYHESLREGVVVELYGRNDNWNGRSQIVVEKLVIIG